LNLKSLPVFVSLAADCKEDALSATTLSLEDPSGSGLDASVDESFSFKINSVTTEMVT
jgi:hypothetical protein